MINRQSGRWIHQNTPIKDIPWITDRGLYCVCTKVSIIRRVFCILHPRILQVKKSVSGLGTRLKCICVLTHLIFQHCHDRSLSRCSSTFETTTIIIWPPTPWAIIMLKLQLSVSLCMRAFGWGVQRRSLDFDSLVAIMSHGAGWKQRRWFHRERLPLRC